MGRGEIRKLGTRTSEPKFATRQKLGKSNILRLLQSKGCEITVLPASTSSDTIKSLNPDGVFLSNGPGDPAAVKEAIECIKNLLGCYPIFGICLGHQLLALALGGSTFKLKYGHRGCNHPVKNLETKKISYIDKPYTRFKGTEFEQNTFFIEDPNGNVLELKTFG